MTDATGAVIPGATIKITGPSGYRKSCSTDAQGAFAVTGLARGNYTLTVSHFGFATAQPKSVAIHAGRTATLTVPLQIQAQT